MTVREAVLGFMRMSHPPNGYFYGQELLGHVFFCVSNTYKNPFDGTVFRMLRLLRQQGEVNYEVICKKKSLYRKLK